MPSAVRLGDTGRSGPSFTRLAQYRGTSRGYQKSDVVPALATPASTRLDATDRGACLVGPSATNPHPIAHSGAPPK